MPIRSCAICKQKKEKKELFRIVSLNGNAYYDRGQIQNTRGIYICKNINCLERFMQAITKGKTKIKINVNSESLISIIEVLKSEMGD